MNNIVDPQWLATYTQLYQENHPLWKILIKQANNTGTPKEEFSDKAKSTAIAYCVTKNPIYATKWYNWTIADDFGKTLSDNTLRREFIYHVLEANMVWDGLSSAQQIVIQKRLLDTVKHVLSIVAYEDLQFEFRQGDSDQSIGVYFGVLAYDLMFGTNYINYSVSNGDQPGGFQVTDLSIPTVRNNIFNYCQSQDGFWIESTQYNLTTLLLMAIGHKIALVGFNGVDYFPEVKNAINRSAEYFAATTFSSLDGWWQNGDDENARIYSGRIGVYLNTILSVGTISNNQKLISLGQKLAQKYDIWADNIYTPQSVLFFYYNPYLYSIIDYPSVDFVDTKRGLVATKDTNKLVALTLVNPTNVDHEPNRYCNIDIRYEDWLIASLIGYGSKFSEAESGWAQTMYGHTRLTRSANLMTYNDNIMSFLIHKTDGGPEVPDGTLPQYKPADFGVCYKSLLWIKDGILVIVDNVTMTNPRILPRFNKYKPTNVARMNKYNHYNHFFGVIKDNNPVINFNGFSYVASQHNIVVQALQNMQITSENFADEYGTSWVDSSGPKDILTKRVKMYYGDETSLSLGKVFMYVVSIDKNVVCNRISDTSLELDLGTYKHQIQFSPYNNLVSVPIINTVSNV